MPNLPATDDQQPGDPRTAEVGEMNARRELMADGRRYIVYYTFGEDSGQESEEVSEDV